MRYAAILVLALFAIVSFPGCSASKTVEIKDDSATLPSDAREKLQGLNSQKEQMEQATMQQMQQRNQETAPSQ